MSLAVLARYGHVQPSEFDAMHPARSSELEKHVQRLHNRDMHALASVMVLCATAIVKSQVIQLGEAED